LGQPGAAGFERAGQPLPQRAGGLIVSFCMSSAVVR
jgi:hypothetical protein